MIYKFKLDLFKTPAQVVGEVCEALEHSPGGLTPKRLVDVSRPTEAPLHGEFEWDDATAAEAYREQQASKLIRALITVPENTDLETRAFVRVSNQTHDYSSMNVAIQRPDTRLILLEQAKRELRAFQTKYQTLQELSAVMSEIDKLIEGDVHAAD